VSAALATVAEHLDTEAAAIAVLPHGILRTQVRDENGIRFSLTAWSTDEPISQFFQALIADEARESLCICIVPTRTINVDRLGEHAFIFYPADVDALVSDEITLWDLLDHKSVRRFLQGRTPIETEYARTRVRETANTAVEAYFPEAQAVLAVQQEWIEHPLRDEIDTELRRGRWTLLVGNSSCGKTILAMQAATYLRLAGYGIRWLNVGTHGSPPSNVLSALARNQELRSAIFFIDDMQSSPGAAHYVVSILRLLQRTAENKTPTLLGISWPAFARDMLQHESDWRPLSVTADCIREALMQEFDDIVAVPGVTATLELLGDDLLLTRLFLERSRSAGRAVSPQELAVDVLEKRTTEAQRADGTAFKAVVVTGTLGQFDIAPRDGFVRTVGELSTDSIGTLVKSGLLRRQADTVTLGHRSLSGLLADWATANDAWNLLPSTAPRGANELVLAYLRSLESTNALDTLSALTARARFRDRQKLNPRAALIIEIWHAFLAMVERIEQQQQRDPTWAGDPSSAMFAAQALARIGKTDSAMRSIEFLRTRWRIDSGQLSVDLAAFSTQRDFTKIIGRMQEEDAAVGRATFPAETIDKNRFHKTWLAGVILCTEAAASTPHPDTTRLIAAIENDLERDGNFYPARVPWSSARVLLGLGGLGRNVHNSDAIAQCAAWLARDQLNGGARRGGIWQGGTGSWNSDLETTALVLLALKAVGYDTAAERFARQFLLSERAQWTAAGEELNGAVALHAFVETGGNFGDVAESARQLSTWARSEALWLSATDRSDFEQSCRVAQIASHLVNIGWTAIRTNLPVFLEALEPRTSFLLKAEAAAAAGSAVTTSALPAAIRPPDQIVAALVPITSIVLDEYTVVGNYRRHDERVRHELRDRVEQIRDALSTKTTARENFLIWAAPGSGKSYLIQETARVLGDKIAYHELNLAKMSHAEFTAALAAIGKDKPLLCLLDEFDARESEKWPYEEAFSLLDWNTTPDAQAVFVAIGSSPDGLHALERRILGRSKGRDLLDRVPIEKRFEIPATSIEDKVIILTSKLLEAAQERNQKLDHIDKFAVYYALTIPELQTPRQLRDLIVAAVARTSIGDSRLHYDHLFQRGDQRNHRFWAEHIDATEALAGRFIRII
jgi:hypothetical protein